MQTHELLMFVHHADETAEARVFFFEKRMQFAEERAFGTLHGFIREAEASDLSFRL